MAERLIDNESARQLKERFDAEMRDVVDVKVYTERNNNEYASFTAQFAEELGELSDKIKVYILPLDEKAKEKGITTDPTMLIGDDLGYKIIYNGAPAGYEASGVVETIIMVSKGQSGLNKSNEEVLKELDKPVKIQVFVTPSCPYCPKAAILAHQIAVANKEYVTSEVVEAQENYDLSMQFKVSSVPQQVINGSMDSITVGVQPESKFIDQILQFGSSKYEELKKQKDEAEKEKMKLIDEPDYPVIVTDETFEEATKKYDKLVVDCWAEWCGPCKMIGPIVEELARDYKGKIVFAKLNVDENPNVSSQYNITSIPSLLVFKDGSLITNLVGAKPKNILEKEILNILQ